jgi:hypothetical protein
MGESVEGITFVLFMSMILAGVSAWVITFSLPRRSSYKKYGFRLPQ